MAQKLLNTKGKSPVSDTDQDGDLPNFETLLQTVGQSQDKEAFVQLFEHFAPRIKSFLMKKGTAPEKADELAQETMLTIWDRAGAYDPAKAKASTWIFTIARNKSIDALRKNAKETDFEVMPEIIADEGAASPVDTLQHEDEREAIEAALENLPEDQSSLIHKSFFEGKSHAAIAEETGIALGTVKSRIRAALEKLRGQDKVRDLK